MRLVAAMEHDGMLEDCRYVLTWLHTMSTAHGRADAQAGAPAVAAVAFLN